MARAYPAETSLTPTSGWSAATGWFFTWLGVVPYLTLDAIGSTLDYIASIRNSEVVFDYMEPPDIFRRDEGIGNEADRTARENG